MSSTNKTANYELSQFIGTDVPGWLSDYNSDMSRIDAGIHAAKVAADSAGAQAAQSANDITTINGTLSTQAAQISAAAQSASTAQTAAGQAQNTADANTLSIEALSGRVLTLENGKGVLLTDVTGDSSVLINYPDGFTMNNSVVLTYQVFEATQGTWRVNGMVGQDSMIDIVLRETGMEVYTRNSRVANAPIKIVLTKF